MIRLLAAAGAAAVLSLAAPTAAFAFGGGQALARGTVLEHVSGGDWHIFLDIHARDHGWNSSVTVHTPTEAFSFTGALCTGTYHDPHGGTSVYIVGPRTWYRGPGGPDNQPFYGFKVHRGGSGNADSSWVDVFLSSSGAAHSACANPAGTLSAAYFPLDWADVHFNLGWHH
jgi:hypothetical protein